MKKISFKTFECVPVFEFELFEENWIADKENSVVHKGTGISINVFVGTKIKNKNQLIRKFEKHLTTKMINWKKIIMRAKKLVEEVEKQC